MKLPSHYKTRTSVLFSRDISPQPSPPSPEAIKVAVALIYQRIEGDRFRFLATLRAHDVPRGNLWEFPGGKADQGETMLQAARREVQEELDIELMHVHGSPFCIVGDDDPSQSREQVIELHAFAFDATSLQLEPTALAAREVRWIEGHAFHDFDWPNANTAIFDAFAAWFQATTDQPPS